jgi:hypothetical protein
MSPDTLVSTPTAKLFKRQSVGGVAMLQTAMVQLVNQTGVHILAGNWQSITDYWPDVPQEEVQQVHIVVRTVSAKCLKGVLSSAA